MCVFVREGVCVREREREGAVRVCVCVCVCERRCFMCLTYFVIIYDGIIYDK